MNVALGRVYEGALDLLFPPRCSGCDAGVQRGEIAFCDSCALSLIPIERACSRCALPLAGEGATPLSCLGCLIRAPRFCGAVASFEHGGALAVAIRRLKWARMPCLAPQLGRLLDATMSRATSRVGDVDLIVPVPLHPRRLRSREYNQAQLLARAMQGAARGRRDRRGLVPIATRALARVRDTPPQTGLTARARRRNVRHAFLVRDAAAVRKKRVLLVDDVLTTGATADACARALLAAGAAEVLVLTLGRAVT